MTHHLNLSLVKSSDVNGMQQTEADFVQFADDAAALDGGKILKRMSYENSISVVEMIMCLRQVSKTLSTSRNLCELLAKKATYFLDNRYSLSLFKRSILLYYFDSLRINQNYLQDSDFIALMARKREIGGTPLRALGMADIENFLVSFPFPARLDFFRDLREEDRLLLLENVQTLNSISGSASIEIALKTPHSLVDLKVLKGAQFVGVMRRTSDQELMQILSSVKNFDTSYDIFSESEMPIDEFARILRVGPSFETCNIFGLSGISDLIAFLTDEELLNAFGHLRALDLTGSDINTVQLKRVLSVLSSSVTSISAGGCSAFSEVVSSLSDQEIGRIFGSVKKLYLVGLDLPTNDMKRILGAPMCLRALYLGCFDVQLIDDLQDEDLKRIFGSVTALELEGLDENPSALAKVLRACSSLRQLTLKNCKSLSEMVITLLDEVLDRIFSKILQLNFDGNALTHQAFGRLMPFTRSLNELSLIEEGDACSDMLIQLIDSLTDDQMHLCFGHIASLIIEQVDLSVPHMIRLVKACQSLEHYLFSGFKDMEELIALLSDDELAAFLGKKRDLFDDNLNLSTQSFERILRVNPTLSYKDVVMRPNDVVTQSNMEKAVSNMPDERFTRFIESAFQVPARPDDILNYRFLKRGAPLAELNSVSFDNISDVIDNLSDEELSHAFQYLSNVSLVKPITARALKRLLRAMPPLMSLNLQSCLTLSEAIDKLTDEELNRTVSQLQTLIVSDTNIMPKAFRRFLKSMSGLVTFEASSCTSLSSAIGRFSDQELRRIFGRMRDLDISHTDIQKISLWRLLSSVQHLEILNLKGCTFFPNVIAQMTNEKLSVLLGKVDDLCLSGIDLTVDALKRILTAASSLTQLALDGSCLAELMDQVSNEELFVLVRALEGLAARGLPRGDHHIVRLRNLLPELFVYDALMDED